MIDKIKFWIDFFKDDKFAWDFKIANFIMKDSLRNYLAVDLLILHRIKDNKADRVAKDIEILFKG